MGLIRKDLPVPQTWPAPRDSASIASLLKYVRERDPIGHSVHTVLAALYLFMLPIAPALESISFALLVGYAVIRLPNSWRCYTPLLKNKVMLALLVWMIIHGISSAWSIDVIEGLVELKAFRVFLVPLALWPILDRIKWLIGAMLLGVFAMNMIQAAQKLELFGMATQGADRARALLHPIQVGAFNLTAMIFYLVALLRRKWTTSSESLRWLILLIVGGSAAALGLVFSGSRGPWIAAIIAIPLCWLFVTIRYRESCKVALILLVICVAGGSVFWFAGGGKYIIDRINIAIEQYVEYMEGGFNDGVGQRLLMWKWASRFFNESPIYGNGAGSFRKLTRETSEYQQALNSLKPKIQKKIRDGELSDGRITAAHPHSAYLHVLSSTGIIGFVPFAVLLILLMLRCIKDRKDHLFADATLFLLIGWMIGTQFDCYNLNGHLFGLFAFIIALTLSHRAKPEDSFEDKSTA